MAEESSNCSLSRTCTVGHTRHEFVGGEFVNCLTDLTTNCTQSQFSQTRQVERRGVQGSATSQLVNGEELTNSEVTTLVSRDEEDFTRTEVVSLITLNNSSLINIRIVGFCLTTSTNTQEVVTC